MPLAAAIGKDWLRILRTLSRDLTRFDQFGIAPDMFVPLFLGQIAAVEVLGDLPKLGLERVNRLAGQKKPRRAEAGRG